MRAETSQGMERTTSSDNPGQRRVMRRRGPTSRSVQGPLTMEAVEYMASGRSDIDNAISLQLVMDEHEAGSMSVPKRRYHTNV